MRVAVLVEPSFRDDNRLIAFVAKLADKHPDLDVLTASLGSTAVERAALARGLRVASFRVGVPAPSGIAERRFDDAGDPLPGSRPLPPPRRFVELYELRPDVSAHREQLWHPDPRRLGEAVGDDAAWELARKLASVVADEVVAFSDRDGWPGIDGVHVFGLGAA